MHPDHKKIYVKTGETVGEIWGGGGAGGRATRDTSFHLLKVKAYNSFTRITELILLTLK